MDEEALREKAAETCSTAQAMIDISAEHLVSNSVFIRVNNRIVNLLHFLFVFKLHYTHRLGFEQNAQRPPS
jgi:hypothetical protein